MTMLDHVCILAGGLGTRIRSTFPNVPKPMIPLNGTPFLQIQIDKLIGYGFSRFTLCVGFKAEQIVAHFGKKWKGCEVSYSIEQNLRGTAGALKYAQARIESSTLVVNGDTYLDIDYRAFASFHDPSLAVASIALAKVEDISNYGEVVCNGQDRIVSFNEKSLDRRSGWVNGGAYIVEPRMLNDIDNDVPVSIEKELFPNLISTGKALFGYKSDARFIDLGTTEGYSIASEWLAR